MANPASHNEPSAEHVIEAVEAIEKLFNDLLVEKTTYMSKCKTIRKIMADEYDSASNRGISKKLLKTKIKERDLERKIDDLTADLEDDERNEYQMLSEKLGEFGDTPLGAAALARADGKGTHAQVGV
jgi:sugar-specific transcriptional regulator TrmB